ncbi:MAG TPA: BrnT family toxin [Candidatus Saccharimonadales bacterium]|nr:BrnT family toxin [Candidatus Saccharimonadales bacterium]
MKRLDWNEAKNAWLRIERGISFEDVQTAIDEGKLLDNVAHPNQRHYHGQRILIVVIENYVFLVPFIEDNDKLFLKTIYPSRKFTKSYLSERRQL